MGKNKDRKRAEQGWIWRNGELVRKEVWYKQHPTPEMKAKAEEEERMRKNLQQKGIEVVGGKPLILPK